MRYEYRVCSLRRVWDAIVVADFDDGSLFTSISFFEKALASFNGSFLGHAL